jgi:hypothetical protein
MPKLDVVQDEGTRVARSHPLRALGTINAHCTLMPISSTDAALVFDDPGISNTITTDTFVTVVCRIVVAVATHIHV